MKIYWIRLDLFFFVLTVIGFNYKCIMSTNYLFSSLFTNGNFFLYFLTKPVSLVMKIYDIHLLSSCAPGYKLHVVK